MRLTIPSPENLMKTQLLTVACVLLKSAWQAVSLRSALTAMALGEAAGCAAALAMKAKSEVGTIDGVKVRETLAQQNAGPVA